MYPDCLFSTFFKIKDWENMKSTLLDLLHDYNLSNKTVLVIGDVILDSYLHGSSTRLCREGPVPIIDALEERRYPGGAGNTAVNVSALGARCYLFSVAGSDLESDALEQHLENKNVNTDNILTTPERKTLLKQRIVADNQIVARIDQGSTHALADIDSELLIHFLEEFYYDNLKGIDAVIISDYGYGIITPIVLSKLQELHNLFDYPMVIDAKDPTKYREINATAFTPNYAEAVAILNQPLLPNPDDRQQQILVHGQSLLHQLNSQIVVVTMDEGGAIVFEQGAVPVLVPTVPVRGSVGGAGDTFIGMFTLALCAGADAQTASLLGVKAATVAVSLPGTASCTYNQLCQSLRYEDDDEKLFELDDLLDTLETIRIIQEGKIKIIFTNGCFDLLHHGHIKHLREASALGDILVVALNSDDSVKRLKGNSRPIHSFRDRVALLAALPFVDFIVPLPGDNPIELIKEIRPDVFVKGGDYMDQDLPEVAVVEELGGEVRILPFHNGYSTTQLIERIKEPTNGHPEGAKL
jgi:D-beta-D-heptose 7-phosphate kinase/D-beta-D-heptose 1-phosphate adenosyltransferase